MAKIRAVCDKPLTLSEAADDAEVSKARMAYAAVVVQHGPPELVEAVIKGERSLDGAYYQVRPTPPPKAPTLHPGTSTNNRTHLSPQRNQLQRAPKKTDEVRWLDRLYGELIVPFGEWAARCAAWADTDLTRFKLPDDDQAAVREALEAGGKELLRSSQALGVTDR